MKTDDSIIARIRPVVLAGGRGTRLRPRTSYLPKPLLPIAGRPMLWYVLNSLSGTNMLPPIVVLGYKGKLIHTYFEGNNIEFRSIPNKTMAEAFFNVVEEDLAEAFLGMSADVLIPNKAVKEILKDYFKNNKQNTALFVKFLKPGHKKWEFVIKDAYLQDILKKDTRTNFERVLIVLTKSSLLKIRSKLPIPIIKNRLPAKLKKFQTGWILILKTLAQKDIRIHARIVDIPVCNINLHSDFKHARDFVKQYLDQ